MNPKSGLHAARFLALALGLYTRLFPLAAEAHFHHINKGDGLSQNTVQAILQDRHGFMWLGTEYGLNRYDGYQFTVFNPVPGDPSAISHGSISTLLEDREGIIWIGTQNGGLNRLDPRSGTFRCYRHAVDRGDSLSGDFVSAILEDSEGTLWIGTLNGLNRFDRASGKFSRVPLAADRPEVYDQIHDICDDRAGGLWISSFGGGITHLHRRTGRLVHFRHDPADPASLSSDLTHSLLLDRRGTLWVCSEAGLNRLDHSSGRFAHIPIGPASENPSPPERIYTITEGRDGAIWLGFMGGLARLDPKTGEMAAYRNDPLDARSLDGTLVFSLCEDRSGILWIGTDSGINQFNPNRKKFAHYRRVPGKANTLGSSIVHTVWQDPGRVLWIGTREGLDRLDRNTGSLRHYDLGASQTGGPRTNIRCLKGDRAGNLWLGTIGEGLQRFDRRSGKVSGFRRDPADPASISHDVILSIAEDLDGSLWIGTYGGGVNHMTADAGGGRFTRFRSDKGDPGSLSDDIARAVLVDRAGNLWVGTHGGGLNRLDPDTGKFFHFRHDAADPSSLNSDFIFCLHEDREGAIWAGTLGGGLNRLDMERGTFTHFTTRDGLASNLVLGILEDRAGDLWLTTSEGLSRFSPQQKQFRNYDASDGIQGQGFFGGSVHASQEGELFVCGADGINAFFPQEILDNWYMPPVRITSFKVMNREKQLPRPIWETAEVVLRPDDYLFSLEFAALDYSYPQKNRYAYRLDGLTREWIYTRARNRVASFSTLAPGRYVFRVRGSNGDGVWNPQETTLVIRVLTPWWRSGWFLSLLLAAAVLAGYEWNRTRIRRRARQVRTEQAMEQLFDRCAVSPREREIARLLLKGLNNKEIGERLFIELGTVKIHVHNVLRKLGVRNRTQLLRLFQNLKT